MYLPLAGATKEAGIVRARTSVLRRHNTVAQFIAKRPILGLCEMMERQGGGARVPQRWWEQPRIDWKLAREQGGKGGRRSGTGGSNCREGDGGYTRIGKGNGGEGVTGGQWLQWG